MDVCPITFNTPQPLLPRLIPSSSNWVYIDPLLEVELVFAEDMDQTIDPLPGEFVITVNDVPQTFTDFIWVDATHAVLQYSEALLTVDIVRCRYSTKNPLFLSVAGELVTPFDILVTAP